MAGAAGVGPAVTMGAGMAGALALHKYIQNCNCQKLHVPGEESCGEAFGRWAEGNTYYKKFPPKHVEDFGGGHCQSTGIPNTLGWKGDVCFGCSMAEEQLRREVAAAEEAETRAAAAADAAAAASAAEDAEDAEAAEDAVMEGEPPVPDDDDDDGEPAD